jgi:hypothetical protein
LSIILIIVWSCFCVLLCWEFFRKKGRIIYFQIYCIMLWYFDMSIAARFIFIFSPF